MISSALDFRGTTGFFASMERVMGLDDRTVSLPTIPSHGELVSRER